MENIGLIVLVVVVFISFTALLTWAQIRKKAEAWQGTVTKIKQKTVDRSGTDEPAQLEEVVYIHYRMDSGKKGKLTLSIYADKQQYQDLKVNDRLDKQAGEYMPVKAG
jgi:hypothetical protein